MGRLVDGVWRHKEWLETETKSGHFKRVSPVFRDFITADGRSGYPAEAGRYHLYVSRACPWAHRTLIFRVLKRLEDVISVSVVSPLMLENGWTFDSEYPDHLGDLDFLHELYVSARPDYSGRVTVPVLWDRVAQTIVNNESSEIIRMLNSEFSELTDADEDYYPEHLREQIDEVNAVVYDHVNNGVYKSGFASKQEAHEQAVTSLFTTLDELEERLERGPYLLGEQITEADLRLFPTLIRFDSVYYGHFKCNLRRLIDYPRLWDHTRRIYNWPGIAETVDLEHIKAHYYGSHRSLNPSGIVPVGPALDLRI